jgi:SAM-dependent methyltransferase
MTTTPGHYVLGLSGFALLRRWYEDDELVEARLSQLLELAAKAEDDVIGTDLTPAMLEKARENVAGAEFREGRFEALPIEDASVDLVTSTLAVCHADDLGPVFAEFARVLRPGGRVFVTDPHPTATLCGGQAFFPDGFDFPFVRNQGRSVSEYFTAATAAGLSVSALHEPMISEAGIEADPMFGLFPDLLRAARSGIPWLLVIEASKS